MRLFADHRVLACYYFTFTLIFVGLEDGDSTHSLGFIMYPGIKKKKHGYKNNYFPIINFYLVLSSSLFRASFFACILQDEVI